MLLVSLIVLIFVSAFFSGSETGMMAVNRYRLRHLMRKSHVKATRVLKLLERPDRLLGVILIGNTFSNILASALATVLAVRWFGELGVAISTVVLTFIVLIFSEAAPKTVAALHPEKIAFFVSGPLKALLVLFYPLVWVVNGVANALLSIFGVRVRKKMIDPISIEELRSMVGETSSQTTMNYQEMLLGVLDLQRVSVAEAMIPKTEIYGIDLDWEWDTIVAKLKEAPHAQLPVYREHIDNVQGLLSLRQALLHLNCVDANQQSLARLSKEVYFIPESVLLHQQLLNFQEEKKSIGMVVDEYGDVQGMLTLRDLLEEIVGAFAMSAADIAKQICYQKDGSALVDASLSIRDINRLSGWDFPTDGPRTLSGLIIEYLELIPATGVSVRIGGYPVEVLSVSKNKVEKVRVWPALRTIENEQEEG